MVQFRFSCISLSNLAAGQLEKGFIEPLACSVDFVVQFLPTRAQGLFQIGANTTKCGPIHSTARAQGVFFSGLNMVCTIHCFLGETWPGWVLPITTAGKEFSACACIGLILSSFSTQYLFLYGQKGN